MMRITPRMATGFMSDLRISEIRPRPHRTIRRSSVGLALQLQVLERRLRGRSRELLVLVRGGFERRDPLPLGRDLPGLDDPEAFLFEPLLHRDGPIAALVSLHRLAEPALVVLALDQAHPHDVGSGRT